jgi:hypothetical protein
VLAHVLGTGRAAIVGNVVHSAPPPFPGKMVGSVLCVLDRGEGGKERLAEVGLTLSSIFTRSELLEAAKD